MQVLDPEVEFREALRRAALSALGLELGPIPLTYPPSPELGDLASPVCFELARQTRRPPRELARAIAGAFEIAAGMERLEVAGAGYLNLFLDRTTLLRRGLLEGWTAPPAQGPKIVVEHTNINPNKAAHIGHLRNAVLGDTLVRLLRHLGRRVEVQNYIDDTGVQVADLVVGFDRLRHEGLNEVLERYAEDVLTARGERFDYIAWELYAEVTRYYAEDPQRLELRESTLAAMERGDHPLAELAAYVAQRMVQHHLRTMDRLDVRYDLLPRESDILALRFWETAFDQLRRSGAIRLETAGKNAGCWVMDLQGVEEGAGEDQKIIVRSSGTVTYVGKDIAYQLWKFGLLGRDFLYRKLDWSPHPARYEVWSTCSEDGEARHPSFGGAEIVYNVIDTRQSYLQRVVSQGLRCLGHAAQAERSIHYAYEMVALTPEAVLAMFPDYPLTEQQRQKPYLEMSGRRGLGVRADDLLDVLFQRASEEIAKRSPELEPRLVAEAARRISVGALRYYMLRFSRGRVVAFDLEGALAFEGETGPYLQYSVVRARNILAKLAERFGTAEANAHELAAQVDLAAIDASVVSEHWNLFLLLLRVDAVLRQAVESLELATLAKHAYGMAQAFNTFYHRYPVVQERDAAVRAVRAGLVRSYHDGMIELLRTMGIDVPDRM